MTEPNVMPELAAVVRDFAAADVGRAAGAPPVPAAAPRATPAYAPAAYAPPAGPARATRAAAPPAAVPPPYVPPYVPAEPGPAVTPARPAAPAAVAREAAPARARRGGGGRLLLGLVALSAAGYYVTHRQSPEPARHPPAHRGATGRASTPEDGRAHRRSSPHELTDPLDATAMPVPTGPPAAPSPAGSSDAPARANPAARRAAPAAPPPAAAGRTAADVEAMLDDASNSYGANAPGRAYGTATAALDAVDALRGDGQTSSESVRALRLRAERLRALAAAACEDRSTPGVDVTGCPGG
ncbi:hypothetical protein tb265_14860 [Gemmatimonadetes bacterium T265]|nr:hypothetical protein tb265_14860 [Gemmatimonadetes bacterium T265]